MDLGLVVLGGEQHGGTEGADRAAEGHGLGAHRDRARPAGGDREREVERHHALAGIAHGGEDRDDAQGDRAVDQEALFGRRAGVAAGMPVGEVERALRGPDGLAPGVGDE